MNAKKIDLVRQMLAKAESTTPEEAEALTAAAEKIMLRLGIDEAMLAASEPSQDASPVVSRVITFDGIYRDGMMLSMYAVLQAMGSFSILRIQGRNTEGLKVYGREHQVDRAVMLVQSLEIQAMVAMAAWWKANKADYSYLSESAKRRQRRQFIISFGHGAGQRIISERTQVEEEVSGSALVLLDEVAKARLAMTEEHPVLRTSKTRLKGGSRDAADSGRSAGRQANVGTTQVGNRKRLSA